MLHDQSLFTYRDTNRRSQAWREVAETVVGFRLFGEFTSSLLRAFLLRMSGVGDSCDWLLVAKNPQASDTPTSKIFLTLLCGRAVTAQWDLQSPYTRSVGIHCLLIIKKTTKSCFKMVCLGFACKEVPIILDGVFNTQ